MESKSIDPETHETTRMQRSKAFLAKLGVYAIISAAAIDGVFTTQDIADDINHHCIERYNVAALETAAETGEPANIIIEPGNRPKINNEQANKTSMDLDVLAPIRNLPHYMDALLTYREVQQFHAQGGFNIRVLSDGQARLNEQAYAEYQRIATELLLTHPEEEVQAIGYCFGRDVQNQQFNRETMYVALPSDINSVIKNRVISNNSEDFETPLARGNTIIFPPIFYGTINPRTTLIAVTGNLQGRPAEEYDVSIHTTQTMLHEVFGHYIATLYGGKISVTKTGRDIEEKWAESIERHMQNNWQEFEHLPPIIEFGPQDPDVLRSDRMSNRLRSSTYIALLVTALLHTRRRYLNRDGLPSI